MTLRKYYDSAQRTSRKDMTNKDHIFNAITGLCGELGEVADLIKKTYFQGHPLNRERIAEELGDLLWYWAEMCAGMQLDPEEVARKNIEKLKRRYPEGFSTEASLHRTPYSLEDIADANEMAPAEGAEK